MSIGTRFSLIVIASIALLAAASCKREERVFRVQPPATETVERVATTDFYAGAAQSVTTVPISSARNRGRRRPPWDRPRSPRAASPRRARCRHGRPSSASA